jgi:hypothetical protein
MKGKGRDFAAVATVDPAMVADSGGTAKGEFGEK